jgi:hypothetical protein
VGNRQERGNAGNLKRVVLLIETGESYNRVSFFKRFRLQTLYLFVARAHIVVLGRRREIGLETMYLTVQCAVPDTHMGKCLMYI